MARASSKEDLVKDSNDNFEKLFSLVESLSDEELNTDFDFSMDEKKKEAHWSRDKNLRDVFIHLYEWHNLLINWIESNTSGVEKSFLPEGYNWRSYGDMNIEFLKKHSSTTIDEAEDMLKKSHKEVMELVDGFTNEELFTKNIFNWTGTTTLGSYCVSSTSSHYDWAIKKLKAHRKNLKKK